MELVRKGLAKRAFHMRCDGTVDTSASRGTDTYVLLLIFQCCSLQQSKIDLDAFSLLLLMAPADLGPVPYFCSSCVYC